jgi:hypothetical protein
MLFMVIERFRAGNPDAVSERFQRQGRLMPDMLTYRASWLDAAGTCCYQLMEATDIGQFAPWTERWSDLIEFEIVPVETSADFWAKYNARSAVPGAARLP